MLVFLKVETVQHDGAGMSRTTTSSKYLFVRCALAPQKRTHQTVSMAPTVKILNERPVFIYGQ